MVFYPVLESSPLERYDEAQQKQLLDGKAIIADVETADGRHSKAFVQIDEGTKQVMYVPTPIIGRNLQVLAEIMHLGPVEVNGMQNGEPLTLVVDDDPSQWVSTCTTRPASASVRATAKNGKNNPNASGTNTLSACTAAG